MKNYANRNITTWQSAGYSLSRYVLVLLALFLFHMPLNAQPRNANNRLCFGQVTNVPGSTAPPTVDGIIRNDLGWTGATRYEFGNGTPDMGVVVQGIRDAANLYLSFEANNDATFDNEDMIVIALDPDATATNSANDRRLHIFPVFTTGAAPNGNPQSQQYSTNSSSWTTATLPAGTEIKVSSIAGGTNSWFVEVKLPIGGFGIPGAGDFGLYFNVMRVSGGTAVESDWPTDNAPIVIDPNNTPTPVNWGNGTFSGGCNGVSFSWSDIKTNNTPPHKITFTGSNIFTVTPHNNTINSTGTPQPANQVKALFKIANFGLPSSVSWQPVPIPAGGGKDAASSQVANIPANGSIDLTTNAWVLNATEVAQYDTPTTRHQCILVELSSTAANTIFVNKSAWRNMDFGPASVFEHVAEISGKGYGAPPDGSGNHLFDLQITTSQAGTPGVTAVQTDQTTKIFTWVAHGFRHTGQFIVINRKRFEILEDVGAFGYRVAHVGSLEKWAYELTGTKLRKVEGKKNFYQISVSPEGVETVTTKIEAVEPGGLSGGSKFGLSLHAGSNFPQGTFNKVFDPGFSFTFDLEYRVNKNFSLEGLFGYNRFRNSLIGPDLNLYNVSGNAKYYFGSAKTRAFVNAGGGVYKFDPGVTRGGVNVGLGVQREVNPRLAIDLFSYNFHTVATPGSQTNFSTVQFGFHYRP